MGMGWGWQQRTVDCSGEQREDARAARAHVGVSSGNYFHRGHGMGEAEAHRFGLVVMNVATRKDCGCIADAHATSLRAHKTPCTLIGEEHEFRVHHTCILVFMCGNGKGENALDHFGLSRQYRVTHWDGKNLLLT